MNKLLTIGTLGAAGVVGAGLLTIPGLALTGSTDEAAVKREDGVAELVLVDDEDDDDTADRSRTRNSRNSRATGDDVSQDAQDRQAAAAGAARQGAAQDMTTRGTSRAGRGTRTGGAGTVTGTVRPQQAPRDNTVSNVTDGGPTKDTVSQDVSQEAGDSDDVSQDSRDSNDSND